MRLLIRHRALLGLSPSLPSDALQSHIVVLETLVLSVVLRLVLLYSELARLRSAPASLVQLRLVRV